MIEAVDCESGYTQLTYVLFLCVLMNPGKSDCVNRENFLLEFELDDTVVFVASDILEFCGEFESIIKV